MVRALAVYLAGISALWIWFGSGGRRRPFRPKIRGRAGGDGGGVRDGRDRLDRISALALVNLVGVLAAAILLSPTPLIPISVAVLSIALIA